MSLIAFAILTTGARSTLQEVRPGKMRWNDEFSRDGRPDPALWGYEKGFVRNDEKQFYTDDRRENARVENGHLIIEARKDNFEDHPISSASLITLGKAQFLYGRLEVRAKVPTGKGTWPAIWMLGTNMSTVGWPMCGEIDIMEYVGFDPEKLHFNIHTKAYNHSINTGKGTNVTVPKAWEDFHTYALIRTPSRMDFELDGKIVFTYEKPTKATVEEWPFDAPQYLLLNLAIGGAWGGQQGVDDAIFPSRYEIDFVRCYAQK